MKKFLLIGIFATLLMTGCSDTDNTLKDSPSSQQDINSVSLERTDNSADANTNSEFFRYFPDSFTYSSGSGAWSTDIVLEANGTFQGEYHDSDMNVTSTDYPNGTMYISKFHGKFTTPQKVDEYTYSMQVEYMELDWQKGKEYIEDGIRYIVLGESELETGEQLLVYIPGTPYTNLPKNFMNVLPKIALGPETLECFAIYNAKYDAYYTGYNYMSEEEIQSLNGSFQNEYGDIVNITILPEKERTHTMIGTIEWLPANDESQIGTILKNAAGGFTFALDESITYSFMITSVPNEKVQFSGVGEYAYNGTFSLHTSS